MLAAPGLKCKGAPAAHLLGSIYSALTTIAIRLPTIKIAFIAPVVIAPVARLDAALM